jgi:LacI family transcriptional regulator
MRAELMTDSGKVTGIKDLAEALGLSTSTVSRALAGNPRISEETRQRVEAQARLMKYNANAVASSLRTGRSKILGVIIPLANRSFFASVISGIEKVANEGGYSVMICQTNEDSLREKEAIDAFLKARVAGIAVSVAAHTREYEHFERVKQAGIPLILFDRAYESIGTHQVVIDDRYGAKMATDHLIQQGCRRILHFGGRQHMSIYKNRTFGDLDSLQQAGIPVDDDLLCFKTLHEEVVKEVIDELLDKCIPFDGIFASSDYAAIGAMQQLQSRGIKVPQEVAIIGFADEPFTKWVTPGLTTVNQHPLEMGNAVANLFLNLMHSRRYSGALPLNRLTLTPDLIIRGSSMRC